MMSLFSSLITVITFLFFSHFCQAAYSSSSRSNVALYWGQGAGQQRLLHFCQQTTVDIIPIGFVNIFPAQGNGYPGTNFGNKCWGPPYVYQGPGPDPSRNQLQLQCPELTADIPVCQSTYGKKIILSLGGGSNTYQLTGAAEGVSFADFLWGAFGPQTPGWLAKGLPRPFDGPNNAAVEVDGFDFDIEIPSTDNQAGYIALIQRLRTLFPTSKKPYLITGAPQCIVTDTNMGHLISTVQFDILFIQYYNTPQCSARSWANANPNYLSMGIEQPSGFSYNAWAASLTGTASANAKLYIGLPGDGAFFLSGDEVKGLVKAYFCKPNFGGVMIWDATAAENNVAGPYYVAVKSILAGYASDTSMSCYTAPPKTSAVLSLSTSTRKTVSSTVAKSSSVVPKMSSTLRTPTTLKTSPIIGSTVTKTIKTSTTPKLSSTNPPKLTSGINAINTLKTTTTSLRITTTTTTPKPTTTKTKVSRPKRPAKIKAPKLTPTTKASPTPSPTAVIPAGACGAPYNNSCGPGFCCSQYGYCGSGDGWCGAGCQKAFGMCS